MRIVILMILILVLISFFGTAILTLINWFTSGGSLVVSTLGIFTDFFTRALSSMFNQAYVRNIFAIFLFCNVVLIIVAFLRGVLLNYDGSIDEPEQDDIDEYEEYDEDGNQIYGTRTTTTRNGKHNRYRRKDILVNKRGSGRTVNTYLDSKGNTIKTVDTTKQRSRSGFLGVSTKTQYYGKYKKGGKK